MKIILLTIIILLSISNLSETTHDETYKVHSLFVYKFTQMIQWPESKGEFVIGIIGTCSITKNLEAITKTKKNGDKTFIIKEISSNSKPIGCNAIFIPESNSSFLNTMKNNSDPILIISEVDNGIKKGAGINLLVIDSKMKFEINKSELERRGLKVSGDLLKLAQ